MKILLLLIIIFIIILTTIIIIIAGELHSLHYDFTTIEIDRSHQTFLLQWYAFFINMADSSDSFIWKDMDRDEGIMMKKGKAQN